MEGLVPSPGLDRGSQRSGGATVSWPLLLLALTLVGALLTLLHYEYTTVWWLAEGERMARFEAAAPFQYRILLPSLVAAVHAVIGVNVSVLFALAEVAGWMLLVVVAERALRSFGIGTDGAPRWALAFTACVPVAAHLIPPDLLTHSLLTVEDGALIWGEWYVTRVFRYVYDLPAAVFTLALVVLLHRLVTGGARWLGPYLVVFVLAVLNRETAMFLIPAFVAVGFRRLGHGTLTIGLLIQVAAVVLIQSTLQTMFESNVNPHANVLDTQYENHLLPNLALLAGPTYFGLFLLRFGAGMWLPVLALVRHLDPFLRRVLVWFGVPFLVAGLVFGRIQEHRVLVELAPLLWLAGVQAIAAYRSRLEALPPGNTPATDSVRPAGVAAAQTNGER